MSQPQDLSRNPSPAQLGLDTKANRGARAPGAPGWRRHRVEEAQGGMHCLCIGIACATSRAWPPVGSGEQGSYRGSAFPGNRAVPGWRSPQGRPRPRKSWGPQGWQADVFCIAGGRRRWAHRGQTPRGASQSLLATATVWDCPASPLSRAVRVGVWPDLMPTPPPPPMLLSPHPPPQRGGRSLCSRLLCARGAEP
jgi:hypothetical protein